MKPSDAASRADTCHYMTQLALHFVVGFVSLENEIVHAWLPAGIRGWTASSGSL